MIVSRMLRFERESGVRRGRLRFRRDVEGGCILLIRSRSANRDFIIER